ncbi:MAG: DEAD/DEAH box helicase family protein [Planctomycetes bacterium]|nr:DEAD/DEAH box helicase family protein [Planctomycetota bacterium]
MSFNEADTRAKLIDPAIHARGWTEDFIRREETPGAVEIDPITKRPRRHKGRIDYVLRVRVNPSTQPVAVALLEAKKESLPPGHGLEQAKGYSRATKHNVPFVFSSNGHLFVEFDADSGLTSDPKPLNEFPTPDELRARYERAKGFSLTDPAARPLLQPYAGGEGQRRYFQDAAIRAVFEKIAKCAVTNKPPRALLSLATGTGKTFIAVNLLKRISDAGQLKRALFLCDRDELRAQGLREMQKVFGSDAAEVYENAKGENSARNARVHVATYQTLGLEGDAGGSFLATHYPPEFFSHIIIDECHRSAWGKWSAVLTRNAKAVQIGLTATPRELDCGEKTEEVSADEGITADNLKYFGDAVYEYGLAQAMDDGYLAACEIELAQVNLDADVITLADIVTRRPRDSITGRPVSARQIAQVYQKTEYEDKLLLPDRVKAMCFDLFHHIIGTDPGAGPHQKTIIFCARDRHADDVATEMNNLYALWCKATGARRCEPYAFKCTAESDGNAMVPDLRASSSSHFIATTVDLLTTGVDVPAVRNIVFFRYMKSPISFYQMIGRGTRLAPGKQLFRVYDYTGATRLFGGTFVTKPASEAPAGPDAGVSLSPPPPPPPPPIVVDGFAVHVTPMGREVVMSVDGEAVPVSVEEYRAGLSAKLVEACPTLDAFRAKWISPPQREEVIASIVSAGYSPNVLRALEDQEGYDLFDVLGGLSYGLSPRTRMARALAFRYKQEAWLKALPDAARAVVEALADQFAKDGTEGLENPLVWQTPAVVAAGGLKALGSAGEPKKVLAEVKGRMFAA